MVLGNDCFIFIVLLVCCMLGKNNFPRHGQPYKFDKYINKIVQKNNKTEYIKRKTI